MEHELPVHTIHLFPELIILFIFAVSFPTTLSDVTCHYESLRNKRGDKLCAMAVPNMTAHPVRSLIGCSQNCIADRLCIEFNYIMDGRDCQLFYYSPTPTQMLLTESCFHYVVSVVLVYRLKAVQCRDLFLLKNIQNKRSIQIHLNKRSDSSDCQPCPES